MIETLVHLSNSIFMNIFKIYTLQLGILLLTTFISFISVFLIGIVRYKDIFNNEQLYEFLNNEKLENKKLLVKSFGLGFIPLIGVFSILNIVLISIKYIKYFKYIKKNEKTIIKDSIIKELGYNLAKYNMEKGYIYDLANKLVGNNYYKELILSSTKCLNNTLANITKTDEKTMEYINEAMDNYYDMLKELEAKPKTEDLMNLESVGNTFKQLQDSIKKGESIFFD